MAVHLPPHEAKVMHFLAASSSEEACWPFRAIGQRTDLDRTQVKRACRKLARRGFAVCEHALWSEDGSAGSGYRATALGVAAVAEACVDG